MKKCILLLSIVLMTMVLLVPACADDVFSLRNDKRFTPLSICLQMERGVFAA